MSTSTETERETTDGARWNDDGLPANLAAAVEDACEWLALLGWRDDWINQENRERVRGCAELLRQHAQSAAHRADAPPANADYDTETPIWMHYHRGLPESCASCGRDIRDSIHIRCEEP